MTANPFHANPFGGLTTGQAIAVLAQQHGDRLALSFHGRDWSFSDIKNEIDRAAARLYGIGIRPGDKVAVWLPNRPEFLWYWLGAGQLGAVAVTLNTRLKPDEFTYQIDQSDCTAVIVPGEIAYRDFLGDLSGVCPELLNGKPGELHCAALPKLRHVVALDAYDARHKGVTDWSQPSKALPTAPLAEDADAASLIAYSSGTTALPKGAMLSHSVFRKAYDHGERFNQTKDDRLYLCVPLFGILSTINGVLTFWSRGSGVILEDHFDPLLMLRAIQDRKCTAVYLLPLMIDRLLEHPEFKRYDISSLRTGIVLTIDPVVFRKAANELGMTEVFTSYGMTETSSAATRSYWHWPLEQRINGHGTVLPDIEVRVADPDSNIVLPVDSEGEIQVRGYCITLGYYNKPEETKRAFAEDNWFKTGDLGIHRADGSIKFLRRVKDGYKHNGFNVATAEVEAAIKKHADVHDVAVTDLPHPRFGAIGAAFVIRAAGAKPSEQEIVEFLKARLSSFKVPAHVFFVDEFPVTAGTGKIQKFKLREMALEMLARQNSAQEAAS
ncbi:MAG: AMP-binding protein [Rhodospirillales bacterium]